MREKVQVSVIDAMIPMVMWYLGPWQDEEGICMEVAKPATPPASAWRARQ